ncbi:hypothetical protein IDSA_03140 [Pseudidiomarina salinarum]|uniref:YqcC-like domain-containing protein n=1 Tax=Pseudidiomarina salinarum TaxID=435908 RepID=A0A094J0W5_9GAMM|nr:YqcC family protein [Pseudidiomarina salinarum]KFZ31699.1 hypothetical protein IDSA_03140 [Pseudidiomarina salinarum]RUO70529.1 hypothetical protein CWI79_03435 [Pseudidiomarina salinarum]
MDQRQRAARLLERIEAELNCLGLWQNQLPSAQALASTEPFAMDTLDFHQWLQFIMLPRMWEIIDGEHPLPQNIAVSPMATHVFHDELEHHESLIRILREFDALLSGTDPLADDV